MSTPIPKPTPMSRSLTVYEADPVYITRAELAAMFTTPKLVLPALPGYIVRIQAVQVNLEPGTVWTLNGATNLVIQTEGSSGVAATQAHTFDASWLGLGGGLGFDVVCSGPSGGSTSIATALFSSSYANKGFQARIVGGQPTGGAGGVWLTPYYSAFRTGRP